MATNACSTLKLRNRYQKQLAQQQITEDVISIVQRVLIVENKLLLGAGIESLLVSESEINVLGVTPIDDNSLIEEIWHVRPDVVVLDAETALIDPNQLLAQLQENLQLRIITVSANNNVIRVYDKQEVVAVQTADLIKIIKHTK